MLLSYDEFVNNYLDGQRDYQYVCAGVRTVDIKNIIASTALPENIQNNEKMQWLRNYLLENGWHDSANDIYLTLAPNGKYSISNGIRQFMIANELGLKTFKATIDIAIPLKYFNQEDLNELESIEKSSNYFYKSAKKMATNFTSYPTSDFSNVQQMCWVYCKVSDRKKKEIASLCKRIAIREGLVPKHFFENKDISI